MESKIVAQLECERLVNTYSVCIDFRHFDKLVSLFSEDAVLDFDNQIVSGRAEISKFMNSRPPERITFHVVSTTVISVETEVSASGVAYLQCYRFDTKASGAQTKLPFDGPYLVGYYEDKFVCENGKWLFSSRKMTPTLLRPFYQDVWSKGQE